jgi:4-hydroxybenzoate polyprenyltransferase
MSVLLDPLKKILDFIIYSNLFISVCVAFFTLQTALIFPEHSDRILEFVLPNFIATFILYNLQRLYFGAKQPNNLKYSWHNKNRRLVFTLILLEIICCFAPVWLLLSENLNSLIGYSCLSILSIFYFLPPLNLRKYGLLKPFTIAFVFCCISIILPLLPTFDLKILIYVIGQFSFIAALAMLFDIRDVDNDTETKLMTTPIKYGVRNSKYITVGLLMIYFASSFFIKQTNFLIVSGIVLGVSLLLTFLSQPSKHNYFYLFLVDGLIILQCVLFLLFR